MISFLGEKWPCPPQDLFGYDVIMTSKIQIFPDEFQIKLRQKKNFSLNAFTHNKNKSSRRHPFFPLLKVTYYWISCHSVESTSSMTLVNQTCWVVGGVGVIGRGIARSFLQAGATVILNSSDESRLNQIAFDLLTTHPT